MKILTLVYLLLVGLTGCSTQLQREYRGDVPIVQIRVYAIRLQSHTRTIPTIEQIKYGDYRAVISDADSISLVCTKLAELKPVAYHYSHFDLRAFCEIEYSDGIIESVSIDSYGEVKFRNVVLEDSYSFLALIGIACLRYG